MPSPFPGMNPWIERSGFFADLHDVLITFLRSELNARMPAGYTAVASPLIYVDPGQRREPDVSLLGRPGRVAAGRGGVATLPGLRSAGTGRRQLSEPVEHHYLEVLSGRDKRLVTAIEVLSPANKRPGDAGRAVFQAKQVEMRERGVNLVEIDLLRGGTHSSAVPRARIEALAGAFDYHVCVTVGKEYDEFHVAAWPLAERLPAFGVPLDPEVEPVMIDLQPLLDRAYDTGRYPNLLDYALACDPPLSPEQAAWAAEVLSQRSR